MTTTNKESFQALHEKWHAYAKNKDVDSLIALYADNAIFESPLVPIILGRDTGILHGKAEILEFLQEGTKRRPNSLRWYRTDTYFTSGNTLVWEYPRETSEGEQIDIIELMEIEHDKISHHRIYWGWFGSRVMKIFIFEQNKVRPFLFRCFHIETPSFSQLARFRLHYHQPI